MSGYEEIAVAKYKFTARKGTELSFEVGDVIVLGGPQPSQGWLRGHLERDDEDEIEAPNLLFPSNYVERISTDKETYVFAVALYDFNGRNESELSLHAGDSLTLVNPDYQNSWITAQSHGHRGLVPSDYVELAEYCDENYEEYADEDEDDAPPPVPRDEDVPPPPPCERGGSAQRPTIRKLNVIRTLRRGTISEDGSAPFEEGAPPPVPRSQGAKAKSGIFVSSPPSQVSQKYSRAQEPAAPPVPCSPMINPIAKKTATATKTAASSDRNKRLSLPPVSSITDLAAYLNEGDNGIKAADDATVKELSSATAALSFSSSHRPDGRPRRTSTSMVKKTVEPRKLDPSTDAKLAAFENAEFEPLHSRDEPIPVPQPAEAPVKKTVKRRSMLLPSDMASLFDQQQKTESTGLGSFETDMDDSYLFDEPDSEGNIQFKSSGELAGANFSKMLAYLTRPSGKAESQHLSSLRSFVECFRMFCTPEQFFEKVKMRFMTVFDGSAIVQRNCIEILNIWTQTAFSVDLAPNKELFDNVQNFLDSVAKACDNMSPVVCQAARHVEQLNRLLSNPVVIPDEALLRPEQYAKEPVTRTAAFLKTPAVDIAHQLCLIQRSILMKVCPVELVRDVWLAEAADRLAPNLTLHVDFCNQKTLWLQEMVVSAKKDGERKKVISHIVDCAEQCLASNNFNGMMIFLSAVQSRSVKLFEKLFSSKTKEKLNQTLLPLIANDCRQLRSIQEVRSPGIPYVDIWLADMAVLNRSTPDKLPDSELINWSKIQVLGMSLRRLQNFQHEQGHTYPPKRPVIALIHAMKPTMKEEQVFSLAQSLLESKKKK